MTFTYFWQKSSVLCDSCAAALRVNNVSFVVLFSFQVNRRVKTQGFKVLNSEHDVSFNTDVKQFNITHYYINTSEIPSELSRENFISSHVKRTCYLHT